jgi:hypothetical protein
VFGSSLAGVMVSMLAIEFKSHGFKLGRGDGFLRTINIRSKPSFGGEVKPSTACWEILRNVKNHFEV